MEAKFLSEREKVIAVERLRANQMGVVSRDWRWDHVWEAAFDVKTYLWFLLILTISCVFPLCVQHLNGVGQKMSELTG
jgi:fucose 4-O-acetylase-like acetyltransferase